jgi:transcription elongation GreA/GreB family factor
MNDNSDAQKFLEDRIKRLEHEIETCKSMLKTLPNGTITMITSMGDVVEGFILPNGNRIHIWRV